MYNITLGHGIIKKEFEFLLPNTNKIGVYFSGGIDSSTLLCLIISQILQSKFNIELYTFSTIKPTKDHLYADRLIKVISDHYNFPIIHQSNIPNPNTFGRVDSSIFKNFKNLFPDIEFYSAGNNMAPSDISKFDRKLGVAYVKNNLYHLPFIDLYKPHIIDLCYKIEANFCLPYTHSCCLQPEGKCNTCYSCLERQWGFKYLGLTDIDTIDL